MALFLVLYHNSHFLNLVYYCLLILSATSKDSYSSCLLDLDSRKDNLKHSVLRYLLEITELNIKQQAHYPILNGSPSKN